MWEPPSRAQVPGHGKSLHTQRPAVQTLWAVGHTAGSAVPPACPPAPRTGSPAPQPPGPQTHQSSQSLRSCWPGEYRRPWSLQWQRLTGTQPLPAMSSYTVPGRCGMRRYPWPASGSPESPHRGSPGGARAPGWCGRGGATPKVGPQPRLPLLLQVPLLLWQHLCPLPTLREPGLRPPSWGPPGSVSGAGGREPTER